MDTHADEINRHLAKYPDRRSAVMPLLYIAQQEYGHITDEAVREIAGIVGVDETHVHGIVGFYTMYYDEPKGKHLLYICTDLPCALKGAEAFSQQVCEHLGVENHGTTEDGLFTVENVMCIGACHRAPVMQDNFHFHEDMTLEKAKKLIDDLRREHEASKPYTH
ncbi:MAG: NAD(P)H-dependent oxidoreductase subunit E [Anaerolineae bacterium]|nr:NAD(P)H-dependent oxidoreductase subunit E [Anaerolineae bacterium]